MRKVKIKGLISLIEGGAAVLTVNARLSRYLSAEYDSAMKEEGRVSWQTPLILPLSSWMESTWAEQAEAPLLGGLRSKALWERIVSSDISSGGILLPKGASDESFKAYKLLKEYALKLPENIYLTEEARAFKKWVMTYEEEVRRLGFVERQTLPERVLGLIEEGNATLPNEVLLAGFDEVTPAGLKLIEGLKRHGVKVLWWPSEPVEPGGSVTLPDVFDRVAIRSYADEHEEVIQAARWARSVVKPGKRVGFIVPDLNRYRELIKREFSAELDPSSVLPWEDKGELFNISLGLPLTEEPLVRSAIDILSIGEGKEELDRISPVLLSPFLSGDHLMMARIDADLKKDNCLTPSLHDLKRRAARYSKALEEKFGLWDRLLKDASGKKHPGAWAKTFSELLKEIGWLASVKLTSSEFQALKAWNALLEGFASLDEITGRLTRAEAAAKISSIASDAIHQPSTPECGVEVVGLLEASGLFFDHVWLMGCHEFAFPPQPSPNPFIPVYLQREKELPHSSYERELSFAKSTLKRILESAPAFEVSYPARVDEKEAKLSPLFTGLGRLDTAKITETRRLKDSVHSNRALEYLYKEPFVPVSQKELEVISGGTLIIKNQSLCPFKAFATHRLNAVTIAEPEPGMTESDRGRLLHTALKVFWEKTEDSKRLKEIMDNGELEAYVKVLSEDVFKDAGITAELSARFIELEKERLTRLFVDWANLESLRGPFRVKHVEIEEKITVEGLTISGRIDRVDETEDGKEVIIDYKSGAAERYDWLTSRPREPQLLVYSLSGRFDTISFARLTPGDCKFVGISKADGVLPSVKSLEKDGKFRAKAEGRDWEGLMDFWKTTVEALAREFLSGYAPVDPNPELKGRKSPCVHCELAAFCRIVESRPAAMEHEEDGEE